MNSATILVVDDEPQLRRVMLATLTDLGYVVVTATSGEEALEKFRHEPPDLVLLDLNMPGMGGLETCRTLRANSDVPIVILAVRLTPKEFDLLRFLVINGNKAVPHRKLLQNVWGPDYGDEVEYLRVFVNALRKKVEPNPSKPKYLLTEPWIGYRFAVPESSITNS
jgi:DNA-binding response OmpR family regulator